MPPKKELVAGAKFKFEMPECPAADGPPGWLEVMRGLHGRTVTVKSDSRGMTYASFADGIHVLIEESSYYVPAAWLQEIEPSLTPEQVAQVARLNVLGGAKDLLDRGFTVDQTRLEEMEKEVSDSSKSLSEGPPQPFEAITFEVYRVRDNVAFTTLLKERDEARNSAKELDALAARMITERDGAVAERDKARLERDKALDDITSVNGYKKLLSQELDFEKEHVLRLKLALSERPLPEPPVTAIESLAWRTGASAALVLRRMIDLPGRAARGILGVVAASWTAFRFRCPGDEAGLVFLIYVLGVGMLTVIPMAVYHQTVQGQYEEAMRAVPAAPAPPSPHDPRERAWIEERRVRLERAKERKYL